MTEGAAPEIYRLEFTHPASGEIRKSVRGNTSGAYYGAGSFRWSSAVQALTVLALRAAAASERGATNPPSISGPRGSHAASLDFAIAKSTTWLSELFGEDEDGKPFCRRILTRSNPELRRSGPAEVCLKTEILPARAIEVFVDELRCQDPARLESLAEAIESRQRPGTAPPPAAFPERSWQSSALGFAGAHLSEQRRRGSLPFPFGDLHSRNKLKSILRAEVLSMLYATNIFNRWDLEEAESRIKAAPMFGRLSGRYRNTPLISEIDRGLLSADRLGISRSNRSKLPGRGDDPIYCCVPVVEIATLALLYHLKFVQGCNLEICFGYSHSSMLLNELRLGQIDPAPDLVFMAVGAAAALLGLGPATPFEPLMLMPRISHRLTAPAGNLYPADAARYGKYLFMSDKHASSQFYFSLLAQSGYFDESRLEVVNMEPHEATSAFRSGDPNLRSIMSWPHHALTKTYGNSIVFDVGPDGAGNIDTMCFAGEGLRRNRDLLREFDIAIRDAWLRLMDEGPALELVLDLLVEDRDYVRFLKRISGMHCLFPPEREADSEPQALSPRLNLLGNCS